MNQRKPTQPHPTRTRAAAVAAVTAAMAVALAGLGTRGAAPVVAAVTSEAVPASADAYVDSSRPAANFGARSTLYADGDPARAILVRFVIPATSQPIGRATLRLYASSTSAQGLTAAATTGAAWDEATVTWATAPAATTQVGRVTSVTAGTWATLDLTSAVSPGTTLTLRVMTRGTRQVAVAARERGAATAPRLVLERTVSDPTPTATPTTPTATPTASPADPQPAFPIRAAFYYPWFPEAWTQSGIYPFTRYQPSRGYYDGTSRAVIADQIADMRYAGLDAAIASWWGQGSKEDSRIPLLLKAAQGTDFRWSLYYEPESLGNPTAAQISADLTYIASRFGADPSYLRVDGKPVVFVYADGSDGCGMADRWSAGNTSGAHVVLKVFPNYRRCANQSQGWHQYAPATATQSHAPDSYAVSPGFWLRTETSPRLARDLTRFDSDIAAMVASNARFQLVTTFNEWGEGTSVESATQWSAASGRGAYLDVLHKRLAAGSTGTPTASVTSTSTPTRTPTSTPAVGDPVIAAAGDIACDPTSGSFNGGAGTANNCRQKATSDLLLGIPQLAAVLPLGDIQYENGALDKFTGSYDPSWGRLKSITKPVPGNHEYLTAGASGYYSYFGAAAGDPAKGYYSYDLGAWHVVALNSNCSSVGGCGSGSAQLAWLKADLAAHPTTCTLAYWHHPLFSSGQHGNNTQVAPLWDALAASGAELVLSGHDHDYERFAAQNSAGVVDPATGIRQFVVGTGGKNHYGLTTLKANTEVQNADTYGVLKVTLHPTSYDWQFIPEPGRTFTDTGTQQCH
jgi:hypothetical protein